MVLTAEPQHRARRARTAQEPPAAPEPTPAPFTLPHFRAWAYDLVLDNGEPWIPEPFFEEFVADVFAGYKECWLIVPEGNTKTTSLAGLALYVAEHQPFANVPVAASSREQAEILYRQAEGFVLRSPKLHELRESPLQLAKGKLKTDVPRFVCLEGYRRINHHLGGRIQIMAADDRTGDGGIPTLAIVDELHRHRDLALYRTWAGKLDKRGGQIAVISTAGEPGGEFETARERIRTMASEITRRGSFTRATGARLVLHEWAVPDKADVHDMTVVKAANPFRRITPETLREKFDSPTMNEEHWRRFVCNLPTRGSASAISDHEWANARGGVIPEGTPIAFGLDVAWKWDTTAGVPFWRKSDDERILGPAEIETPPRDGSMLDSHKLEAMVLRVHARNPIHTVVMDRSRAEQLAQWIEETIGAVVIDWPQTNPQAVVDYDRFMEALRLGRLKHAGDPGLTQHALNAIAKVLPLGDVRFDRPASGRDTPDQERRVIDALTAAYMVHSQSCDPLSEPSEPEFFAL